MQSTILKLARLSEQPSRTILGVMSGTSMDGIDLALCRVEGSSFDTKAEVLDFAEVKISESLKKRFGQIAYRKEAPLGEVMRFEAELTDAWMKGIRDTMDRKKWNPDEIDLAASHGQTILHLPDRENRLHNTLQIVDGDQLAWHLGVPVVSDFRQKHIAAGYEGAPLAPLAEVHLFAEKNEDRILLNLGGIANFTLLKAGLNRPEVPFATDTGPANTLIDESIKRLMPGRSYDNEGLSARSGHVDDQLLEKLLDHPFFSREFPKSTGQEDFHWDWVFRCLTETSKDPDVQDLLATLTELTATTVASAIRGNKNTNPCRIYVSGGGWHNAYLMERLQAHLQEYELLSSAGLGMDPEAKEAILFAVLANELIAGQGWVNSDGRHFTVGKISLP